MRAMELTVGLVLVLVGVLILLAINGLIALAIADIAGMALIASGIFFIAPGLYWRRALPWLTALFIPGLLAVAGGVIVIYARHAGWDSLWYLWVGLLVAIGLAFVAMYYLGPHERWLWFVGILIGGISLFLLAILLVLLSPIVAARVAGSAILILLGLIVATRAVVPRRPSRQLVQPRE